MSATLTAAHNLPYEALQAFTDAIVEVVSY